MQVVGGPSKRPNTSDQRCIGQLGRGRCGRCGRVHEGNCQEKGDRCLNFRKTGHFIKDFSKDRV